MRLTKEQLKQIIKEELDTVTSEVFGGKGFRSNKSFEDDPRDVTKTEFDWINNEGSYIGAVVDKINNLAQSDSTKLGAPNPGEDQPQYAVWLAKNGLALEPKDYLSFHQKAMGQIPEWGDENKIADEVENAFIRALPPRNRPNRTMIKLMKGAKSIMERVPELLSQQEFVNSLGIYSSEEFKQRFKANGGNLQKLIGDTAYLVADVQLNELDFESMGRRDKANLRRALERKGRVEKDIAKYIVDNFTSYIKEKLKKRSFMDKAGSFVRGKGFKEE